MMRKVLLVLLAGLSLILVIAGLSLLRQQDNAPNPTTASRPTPASVAEVPRTTVQELHAQLQGANPPLVWEVRSAEAYEGQHIPGSRRVDLDQINTVAGSLDRQQPIVILCA